MEGDLREGVRYLKLESPKDKWVLWTGGAINHHDPSVSEHLLRYVGAGLKGDESLLLGVDLRDDMEALHSFLSHEAVGEQEHGLIAYLNQELNLGLAPGGFRFQVKVEETICRLVLQLVAEEPMDFGSLGASLKAGDAIDTGYVYVYEKATVKSVIQKAGLSLVGEWIDRSQDYGLFLLRRATGQP